LELQAAKEMLADIYAWHGLALAAVMPKTIVVRGAKLAKYVVQKNGRVICAQAGLAPVGTIHVRQEVFP